MDKLRVFTAFSGYDSQCLALDRLGIDYELGGWSEIDKYAIQAHNALYPQWADRNYGDISKINWDEVPDFDLFTYSSPCQDFSKAGFQQGGEEGSGTRSSLIWECRKAILAKKPKYLLLENVVDLVSQKFIKLFNKWQMELESYGYSNYAQVLNANDYGVPQNRERIFSVSILGDEKYYFPQPIKLEKRMKDLLEENVDDKFFISDLSIDRLRRNTNKEDFTTNPDGNSKTILASLNKVTTFDNYIKEPVLFQYPRGNNKGGIVAKNGICPTISTSSWENNCVLKIPQKDRIRKLTPKECFRLMGVWEREIDILLNSGTSNTQLYKMAGNSIVVDVLYHIFRKLFIEKENENLQQTLF